MKNARNIKPLSIPSRQRRLLGQVFGVLALGSLLPRAMAAPPAMMKGDDDLTIDVFNASGKLERSERTRKLTRSEAQWRQQLSEISFLVTRKEATERPFTGKDWDNHMDGLYRCICCDTALFDSRTKFESGTGWPSFWQPLSGNNVIEATDRSFGMVRTSVSCHLCDAHLGHVFDDGPKPTGLRYCMNSASMRFVRRA